ncbi:MAG: hypothetical protein HDS88_01270 [Bacteroidales bacterium]|nr:hypothetical protein [Bacteroidales bacterium]MBD5245279.1 hypothetical protein [Barnesiella sp.]
MKKLFFTIMIFSFLCGITTFALYATETNTESGETYVCKRCDGTGYEPSMTKNCPYCTRGRVKHFRDCEKCYGSGYTTNKYGDKEKCYNCDGTGKKHVDEQCAYCNGTGSVRMTCMQCKGSGTVNR